ncbi:MAG: hypothetical protein BWY30_00338 [Tenericutes bacterium ADurb.Bin239]|nr:MAG: hypothetical protein BWY30_00338 [Tenericutes bacterium ADurb.Bin239]
MRYFFSFSIIIVVFSIVTLLYSEAHTKERLISFISLGVGLLVLVVSSVIMYRRKYVQ